MNERRILVRKVKLNVYGKQYGRGLDIFDPLWRLLKQTTKNQITAIVIFIVLKMLTSNAAFTASIRCKNL